MRSFAVIGKSLIHSFSPKYFAEKFERLNISNCKYSAIELASENELVDFLQENSLDGFNVTIPFKETISTLLDELSQEAKAIGAVNCVQRTTNGWKGYNTDVFGFKQSLEPKLSRITQIKKAAILGTGGAAKAVAFALSQLKIEFEFVSRTPSDKQISYESLNHSIEEFNIFINTTPLGTFPNISEKPPVDYGKIEAKSIFYDLTYNPSKTAFLKAGLKQNGIIKNGFEMLQLQADKSWEIWNQ